MEGKYEAAAVGEVNVVTKMKDTEAIIGGEGNGGIIYPSFALWKRLTSRNCFVSDSFGREKMKCSELKATYPSYFMSKNKIQLTPNIDVDALLKQMEEKYAHEQVNNIDGVEN